MLSIQSTHHNNFNHLSKTSDYPTVELELLLLVLVQSSFGQFGAPSQYTHDSSALSAFLLTMGGCPLQSVQFGSVT